MISNNCYGRGKQTLTQYTILLIDETSIPVMVNFMCQLGWVMVLRYLVNHQSRCLFKGIFKIRLTFMSIDLE